MKRIALLIIMCLVLSIGCSSPAVIDMPTEPEGVLPSEDFTVEEEPVVEEQTPLLSWEPGVEESLIEEPVGDESIITEPEVDVADNFMPDFPWDEIGWTVSRRTAAEDGAIYYLGNRFPHPSVVGLPEEVPGRGWPTDPEQEAYVGWSHSHFRNGTVVLFGHPAIADVFVFEDNRGIEDLRNPSYSELLDFLAEDKTEELPYIPPKIKGIGDDEYFVCQHFAELLQENANNVGLRAAVLFIHWDGGAHALSAFETTDKGLIWVSSQGSALEGHVGSDMLFQSCNNRSDLYPVVYGDTSEPPSCAHPLDYVVYVW